MGLICFNLLLASFAFSGITFLVFGITFLTNSHDKNKSQYENNSKRSHGITFTVFGSILTMLFLLISFFAIQKELDSGADIVSRGTIFWLFIFLWWLIIPVSLAIIALYFIGGIGFVRKGRDRKTGEVIEIDYLIFGRMLLIFGILIVASAVGVLAFPATFQA